MESEMEMSMENCNVNASGVISREIGEINLAYMLLAQKLVKQDRAEAMFRLGVGRELADLLANMHYGEGSDTWSASPLGCAAVLATLDEFVAALHAHPVLYSQVSFEYRRQPALRSGKRAIT